MDKNQLKPLKQAEKSQVNKLKERAADRAMYTLKQSERVEESKETIEELIKIADTNISAAETLATRFLMQQDAKQARPYILKALYENNLTAATYVEGLLEYGNAEFSRDIEIYSLVVEEQYYDDGAGKKLFKIMNNNNALDIKYVAEADARVLRTEVMNSLLTAFSGGQYDSLEFVVENAAKHAPVRDYKNSYVLSINLYNGGTEPAYEDYGLYIFNPRIKIADEAKAVMEIFNKLKSLGDECGKNFNFAQFYTNILNTKSSFLCNSTTADTSAEKNKFYMQKGNITDKQVGISVNATKNKLFNRNACEYCGADLGGEKYCPRCGKINSEPTIENTDTDNDFTISVKESQQEKVLNSLVCPQCGGAVYVNGVEGATTICQSCGCFFILNKKALGVISAGMDFKSVEADKPKNAEIPQLSFIIKSLFNGKLGVIMPDCFQLMDAELKAIKYPKGTPPQFVYTDDAGKINFSFSVQHGQSASNSDIPKVGEQVLATFRKIMPTATFGDNGVFEKDDHKIAYFECITPAADTHIYNYMIYFFLAGNLMCGAFNCIADDRWFWSHIFKLAMRSMQFDDQI